MTKPETGLLILVAIVVAVFLAILSTEALVWLSNSLQFNTGANVIQWTSGPATFSAVIMGFWMRYNKTCAVPWCPRLGEHPVDGTLKHVCNKHHTLKHHELVYDLHQEAHKLAGLLERGQSHGKRGVVK